MRLAISSTSYLPIFESFCFRHLFIEIEFTEWNETAETLCIRVCDISVLSLKKRVKQRTEQGEKKHLTGRSRKSDLIANK